MQPLNCQRVAWLSICVVVACASDPYEGAQPPEPTPIRDYLIVSKHRVGPISVGQSVGQLYAVLGEPSDQGFYGDGSAYYEWGQHGLTAFVDRNGNVRRVRVNDSRYTFSNGVRVGVAELRVRSILGLPRWIRSEGMKAARYCFSDWTEIQIQDGLVQSIAIYGCQP
jgi:hypothetical protein